MAGEVTEDVLQLPPPEKFDALPEPERRRVATFDEERLRMTKEAAELMRKQRAAAGQIEEYNNDSKVFEHRGGGTANSSKAPSLGGMGVFNVRGYGTGGQVTGKGGAGTGGGTATPGSAGSGEGFGGRGSGHRVAQPQGAVQELSARKRRSASKSEPSRPTSRCRRRTVTTANAPPTPPAAGAASGAPPGNRESSSKRTSP